MKIRALGALIAGLGITLACSGGGDNGGNNAGGAGGGGGTGGTGGSGAGGGTSSGAWGLEDPGADAPLLELPADVTQAAASIVDAPDLASAISAMHAVLAKSGVAVIQGDTIVVTPEQPAASAYVELGASADIALEARRRKTQSTMTATEIATLLVASGWETTAETPARGFMKLLNDLISGALENPSDPSSFPLLMIAANNQLQTPRANLALAEQNPDLVRFSLLDLELLIAAFDRVSIAEGVIAGETGPCGGAKKAMGNWGKPVKMVFGEAHGQMVKQKLGPDGAKLLKDMKLVSKLIKLAQLFRYGTIHLTIDTENPTKKPRPSEANKHGKVTAHAGVDQKEYDDYVNWLGQNSSNFINDVNVCFEYLGFPTKTDITDVAKDAANWRVSWDIVAGGATEVLWKEGQEYKYYSRLENGLTPVSATEAINSVEYRIMPQLADIDHGNERTRHAVFKAQLRRGKPLDPSSLWSSVKEGFKSGKLADIAAEFDLTNAVVDLLGNWLLEVASPSNYATQELIEIVPKGWVGTILLSEEGQGGKEETTGVPPYAGWSGWSAKLKYETRLTLGGSDSSSTKPNAAVGFGRITSSCELEYKLWSGNNNCYEGCPSTVPPSPDDVVEDRRSAHWGRTGLFGAGALPGGPLASVQMIAYPAEMFGGAIDQLPPDIKAKVGTYELVIAATGCGMTDGLRIEFSDTYDEGVKGPTPSKWSVTQDWAPPFPPIPGHPPPQSMQYSEPLPQGKDPTTLEKDWFVPREITVPGTSAKIKTFLRLQIRLKREE